MEFGSVADWIGVLIALIALVAFFVVEWDKLKDSKPPSKSAVLWSFFALIVVIGLLVYEAPLPSEGYQTLDDEMRKYSVQSYEVLSVEKASRTDRQRAVGDFRDKWCVATQGINVDGGSFKANFVITRDNLYWSIEEQRGSAGEYVYQIYGCSDWLHD